MILEKVLEHVKRGGYLFPLIPNSKLPAEKSWPSKATQDEDKILDWVSRKNNIGLFTGRFGANEALLVIDVDVKGDKQGVKSIESLKAKGYDFPDTLVQYTPSGGFHLVYKTKTACRQGVNVLGPGLDIRSRGGYVVASGSELNGIHYDDNGKKIAEAPKWLTELLERPKKNGNGNHTKINETFAIERAQAYLKNEAPLAVEGNGGDHTTFAVAAKLKDFGLSADTSIMLLSLLWNDRCSPPWSATELENKVRNAFRYGVNPPGIDAPENIFSDDIQNDSVSYLEEINKHYALIYIEGSHFILHETVDEKGRKKTDFLTETTFKRRFSPLTVRSGKRLQSQAEAWLNWSKRREYKGLCFAPERPVRNGYYNLWSGFVCKATPYKDASEQAKKGFDMFLTHVRKNIAVGNPDHADWILGYFAHMIQKPYERPLTTLVFRGSKGTGKNVMVDRVGRLLGSRHYLVAHDGRYLTSNFNGYLDSCLCLVLDEAFWSGDKAAEGKLKGLTTAPEIIIERKGKEPYTVDNLVRMIVIGNEEWVVPASHDERRYAVFEVGEEDRLNNRFFSEMVDLMDNQGGEEILLHYLKTFDLSKVNVNIAPKTLGLLAQQTSSLSPFERFWFECLQAGYIQGADFEDAWPEVVTKDSMYNAFKRYSDQVRIKSWMPTYYQIQQFLSRICPSAQNTRRRLEGERQRIWMLPSLEKARQEWDAFLGQPNEWPLDD